MSHLRADGPRGRLGAGAVFGLVALMGLGGSRSLAQVGPSEAVVFRAATGCLNVRVGPDPSTRALECVPPGTRMALIESGPSWGRVRLTDGREGWVALRLVSRKSEPPGAAGAEDRETRLRRLGELEARARRLEEELAAQQAEAALLKQSVEDSRELFAARLEESDRLLATSAALRQRLEEEKAGLEARVAELESVVSAARAEAEAQAAACAEAESAAAAREQDLQAALEASEEQRQGVELANEELAARLTGVESTAAAREQELSEALETAYAAQRQLEEENAELVERTAELGNAVAAREQELAESLAAAQSEQRRLAAEKVPLVERVTELESAARAEAAAQAAARAEAEAQAAARVEAESAASARERDLRQTLAAAEAQRRTIEQEKADLEARFGALESGHAEAIAQLESRLRAAEGFLAASEVERRGFAERLAEGERMAREPGAGASAAGVVEPLRVSIPPEGAAPPAAPPVPGQAGDRSEEVLRGEVLALVESWAAAWSERRVDDYLSFYSGDFQPPSGASRAEWEQSRRERVGRPEEIEVTVALMDIRIEGATRAEVDLIQSYDSSAYSDTVLKTLTLGRERDRWRIVRETLVEE